MTSDVLRLQVALSPMTARTYVAAAPQTGAKPPEAGLVGFRASPSQ